MSSSAQEKKIKILFGTQKANPRKKMLGVAKGKKLLNPDVLDLDGKVQKCHEPNESFVLARECSIKYTETDPTKILSLKNGPEN